MTPQEFIAKYEGWFSYTRREELKKEMESDLDAVFQALHQPPVMGRSEQLIDFAIKNGYIDDMPKGQKDGLIDKFEKLK